MPRPTRRARRNRRGLTLAVLVVASIAIITLDYRGQAHGAITWAKRGTHDAFAPVQQAVDDVVRPIGSLLSGAVHGGALESQNAKLSAQVGGLRRQVLAQQATENTLRSLERLDGLPRLNGVPAVTAQVTALSTSDFAATGMPVATPAGMPVVGADGLVGQVIEVWSSGSVVRLVTDARSSVGVRFGSDGDLALVQGSGLGKALAVNLISPGTALHRGEILTTSGLQGAEYPPDIPVARVRSFSSTPSASQEDVTAEPLADLPVLAYVDVLQWQPSA